MALVAPQLVCGQGAEAEATEWGLKGSVCVCACFCVSVCVSICTCSSRFLFVVVWAFFFSILWFCYTVCLCMCHLSSCFAFCAQVHKFCFEPMQQSCILLHCQLTPFPFLQMLLQQAATFFKTRKLIGLGSLLQAPWRFTKKNKHVPSFTQSCPQLQQLFPAWLWQPPTGFAIYELSPASKSSFL